MDKRIDADATRFKEARHEGATISVQDVIDRGPMRPAQWRVVGLVASALVLEGFDIQLAAFAAPAIRSEWALDPSSLGPALAAAMMGMVLGGIVGGSLGDRWGRRPLLVAAIGFFGLMTLLTCLADNLLHLTLLRLIGGLGFGAAYPNATVLVGEWTPLRLRARAVTLLTMGMPIGGLLGASLSSYLIPLIGWRYTFAIAGTLPIAIAAIMHFALPESLIYLSRDKRRDADLRSRLALFMSEPIPAESRIISTAAEQPVPGQPKETIFARSNARVTTGMWIAFLGNLAVAFLLMNWLPMLLTMLGADQARAIRGSFYLNLAGLVGLVMAAWLYARLGSKRALLAMIVPAILSVVSVGLVTRLGAASESGAVSLIVLAGACIAYWGLAGMQAGLWSLCLHAYSVATRATGLGWGNSIGRIAAIGSTVIGGTLLGIEPSPLMFLLFVACALLLPAAGILIIDRHAPPVTRNHQP